MKKEINPEQGKRLRECLNEQRFSQKELAEKSGYTPQYISNIVVGKKNMSYESASAFAKILGVKTEFLLCECDYRTKTEEIKSFLDWEEETRNAICNLLIQMGYEVESREEYQNLITNEIVIIDDQHMPPPGFNELETGRVYENQILYERDGEVISQPIDDYLQNEEPEYKRISKSVLLRDSSQNLNLSFTPELWRDFLNDLMDYIDFRIGRLNRHK